AFILPSDDQSFNTINSELQAIRALSGKYVGSITVLKPTDGPPSGCAVFVPSPSAAVFLEVKGRVDLDVEIKKARTKMQKAAESAAKQRKLLEAPDFEEKVSKAVRDIEHGRLQEFLAEQKNYEQSIEQFEKLKLDEKV